MSKVTFCKSKIFSSEDLFDDHGSADLSAARSSRDGRCIAVCVRVEAISRNIQLPAILQGCQYAVIICATDTGKCIKYVQVISILSYVFTGHSVQESSTGCPAMVTSKNYVGASMTHTLLPPTSQAPFWLVLHLHKSGRNLFLRRLPDMELRDRTIVHEARHRLHVLALPPSEQRSGFCVVFSRYRSLEHQGQQAPSHPLAVLRVQSVRRISTAGPHPWLLPHPCC